ncbi:hypothetical protein MIMGU_mgv1a018002mg [Erythranthe guttata]|uniref:BHLH domain-containing protein n=1 Tax=Erythranthe guttata TaxID=4155 RepID=A0A022RRI9_ERYGU|nr:hypothetical protein MIMGU_mgv1a018002mg [Erythranthe guttata]
MVEELKRDSFLWDDESWEFPIPAGQEENGGGKMLMDVSAGELDGGQRSAATIRKGDVVEAPPRPPVARGKKKRAAAGSVAGNKSGGGGDGGRQGNGAGCGGGGGEGKKGGGEGGDVEHELHIWTERERRKKMRDMFANLHSLIPHLPPRADKSTIVDEAVVYIKQLQQTLETLEKKKAERALKGKTSAAANLTACDTSTVTHAVQSREGFLANHQGSVGSSANPGVTLANPNSAFSGPEFPAKKPGLLAAIFFVLDKYKIEVLSAQVSSDRNRRMYTIVTNANGGSDQFPEGLFMVEEIYRLAAAEIMLWVNS